MFWGLLYSWSVFIIGPLNCGYYLQNRLWVWKKNHQVKFKGFCQAEGQTEWSDWCFLCTNLFFLFAYEHLGGNCQCVLYTDEKQWVDLYVCSLDPAETVNTLLHFAINRTAHAVSFGLEPQIYALGCIWTSHLQVKMHS